MNIAGKDRERDTVLYRLEIDGRVPTAWKDRFGAHAITWNGGNTVLDLRLRDQAELLGRLRRVHDLNLGLISVRRISPEPGR